MSKETIEEVRLHNDERIQDEAEKKCKDKAPFSCQCDKNKMIDWVEDNWLDFVDDKHKHLFGDMI